MVPADPVVRATPRNTSPGPIDRLERLDHGRAGDRVVPEVVPELVELVEDDEVLARVPQLVALVEDLLDVRLRARES